jgi:hypothetical protein
MIKTWNFWLLFGMFLLNGQANVFISNYYKVRAFSLVLMSIIILTANCTAHYGAGVWSVVHP